MSLEKKNQKRRNNTSKGISQKPKNEKKQWIQFEDKKAEKFFYNWVENSKWKFDDFKGFFEFTNLKTPVKIENFCEKDGSFECLTADLIRVKVELSQNFNPIMKITEGTLYRQYELDKLAAENTNPIKLTMIGSRYSGKSMEITNSKSYYYRKISIDENHHISIWIKGIPDKEKDAKICFRMNNSQIQDYLFHLESTPLLVENVYDTLVNYWFRCDEIDIKDIGELSISYYFEDKHHYRLISEMKFKNGKLQNHAIIKSGETFSLSSDGSWGYESIIRVNGKNINDDDELIHINGSDTMIRDFDMKRIFDRSKREISKLKDTVK